LKSKDWLIWLKKRKLKRRARHLLSTKSCSRQLKQHLLLLEGTLLVRTLPVVIPLVRTLPAVILLVIKKILMS
jgi:hypothetical protein